MSFLPVPNPNDSSLGSQAQLQQNFQQMNNAFSANHLGFTNTDPSNQGIHTGLILDEQSGDPGTLSDEVALYAKEGTNSQPQLFFQGSSNDTPIQMSYENAGTYTGETNIVDFTGSTGVTVNVNAPGNTFVLNDLVVFRGIVGEAIQNNNLQGVVTITGSTFTFLLQIGTQILVDGSVTEGVVERVNANICSFLPGPYVVLSGIIPNIKNNSLINYATYFPSNISFSSTPFVILNPTNVSFKSSTNTGFTISTNISSSFTLNYVAIGKP